MAEVTVKSAEQKLIEAKTAAYLDGLRKVLNCDNIKINVEIEGMPLNKIGHMAECAGLRIRERKDLIDFTTQNYLREPFTGNGYTITEISE